ncbi:influenza virus NS1A-binding protein homolog [Plodia interpunctella]|uniref:influenza virus NS1A-binding protein homolog n=1 Tax=Plodia interpunctella TaxID=58824 RepID=UPI00236876B6|nr:influenza virus NS1A-binding protein homolog [Plodia interpunctella]
MKPHEDYRNGDVGGGDDSEGEEAALALEEELSFCDEGAPARALAALNALRKSRQHYDVLLLAGGAEVPAHGAVLAAASPYLLETLASPAPAPPPQAAPAYKVDDVEPEALKELVEYAYTGKVCVRSVSAARRLYVAAWRLRVEAVRAALAARLLRRLAPTDALAVRALPDLSPEHRATLDDYIAQNFEELCSTGALASLPVIRIEMLRASSAEGGEETPLAVAGAALAWLRDRHAANLEELCSRSHLLFVDGGGELRDCGELPERGGDAPELQQYRREAAARGRAPPAARAPPLPALELGARTARGGADCAVLAARPLAGTTRTTRALIALRGRLALAHVAWTDAGEGVAVGGVLGGARAEPAEGERRACLPQARCAAGAAALRGRLLAAGGYDRARVLQDAAAYDPAANAWAALPNMRSARARFPAVRLGDAVYIVGGSDGHTELDSVDVFRPDAGAGGSWSPVRRLPLAASHAAAAADEERGELYVVGGWAAGRSLKLVHKYSPKDDAWTEAPPLNTGRSQCASVWWGEALWVLGGCDAWHCLASTELLPRAGRCWGAGPPLPTPRRSMGGAVWRGRLVSVGGSDGAASLRSTEWLQPGGGWRAGPALRRARAALALAVLGDVLYAAGGFDGKEFLWCVECLYSPDGEWSTLCSPPPPAAPLSPSAPHTADPLLVEKHEGKENKDRQNGVVSAPQRGAAL